MEREEVVEGREDRCITFSQLSLCTIIYIAAEYVQSDEDKNSCCMYGCICKDEDSVI